MSRGGARVWGNAHPAAQLTEKKVIRYRALVRAGKATVGEIAAKEGCSHGRISMAMRGETWAHLNDVAPPVPGRPRGPATAVKVAVRTTAKTTAKKTAQKTAKRAAKTAAKTSRTPTATRTAGAKNAPAKTRVVTKTTRAVPKRAGTKQAVAKRGVAKRAPARR